MRIGKITSIDRRFNPVKVDTYGIISYGEYKNNYPQEVKRLLNNSVTGSSCLKIYKSFIQGQGFVNQKEVLNQNMNKILPLIADDLATYGGFALAVNYNANYEVSSIYHIPFENVRLAYNGKGVKIHPDWAKENVALKQFDPKDIVNLSFYNPENVEEEVIAAGGWEKYNGQCFYYSNKGERCYPLPVFDAALVDMSTEEAIADITHRNAKNGFYPAGLLVNISSDVDTDDDATEEYIKRLQGSQDAAKIGYCQVANESEVPKFVAFNGTNYDKDFQVSRESAKNNIIKAFQMPPVLASEDVGSSFGSELINQAYKLYNALTKVERIIISNTFVELFPEYDWTITELKFEEDTLDKQPILEVVLNKDIDIDMKKRILVTLYKMPVSDVNELLNIKEESI